MRKVYLIIFALSLLSSCTGDRDDGVVALSVKYTSFHIEPPEVRASIKERLIEAGIPTEERTTEVEEEKVGYLVWPEKYDQQAYEVLDGVIKK